MEGSVRLVTPKGVMLRQIRVLWSGIRRMPKKRQRNGKVRRTFLTSLRPGTAFTDRKVRHLNHLSWLITWVSDRIFWVDVPEHIQNYN